MFGPPNCLGRIGRAAVYGTTRAAGGAAKLERKGIKPIVANYVERADVDRAIKESGATALVFLTDFFLAAKNKRTVEAGQGKMMVDAAKAAGIAHTIFLSVGDGPNFDKYTYHIHAKLDIEEYLKASGLRFSILRPVMFCASPVARAPAPPLFLHALAPASYRCLPYAVENYDEPAAYNPLTEGSVKSLVSCSAQHVSTFDVGIAAAAMLKSPEEWAGKTLECASWKGSVADVAAALQKVSGTKTSSGLAVPICMRSLFLSDLHHMCLYIEGGYPGTKVDIPAFNKVVSSMGFTPMDAEAWFRYKKFYANGKPIAKA